MKGRAPFSTVTLALEKILRTGLLCGEFLEQPDAAALPMASDHFHLLT